MLVDKVVNIVDVSIISDLVELEISHVEQATVVDEGDVVVAVAVSLDPPHVAQGAVHEVHVLEQEEQAADDVVTGTVEVAGLIFSEKLVEPVLDKIDTTVEVEDGTTTFEVKVGKDDIV